ncbi:hypothetical protein E2C01_023441 [Portunus trituberculatus]|uniref:Uncharacterized protein n=1 Tax=Portunus trituberculatus TaxID=210409 RepID=A0A5B7E7Z8_PORTR|nr:hypothetical protein [Portunus trituberculatus]
MFQTYAHRKQAVFISLISFGVKPCTPTTLRDTLSNNKGTSVNTRRPAQHSFPQHSRPPSDLLR